VTYSNSGRAPARWTTLVVTAPRSLRGTVLQPRTDSVFLGRDADLVVPDESVSRKHAHLWWAGDRLWIEDCGSRNGTTVNGVPVGVPVPLAPGDTVGLGRVLARVESTGSYGGPSAPRGPEHPERSETTRYLCGATHLDEDFARRVIHETVDQHYRATAPSYGVDLGSVARHALAARRRRLARDAALLPLLLTAVATTLTTPFRYGAGGVGAAEDLPARLGILLVLAWVVVAVELWVARYRVVARQLAPDRYDPAAIAPPGTRRAATTLGHLTAAGDDNVVVFRGFDPFVGGGVRVDRWFFPVDISKGLRDPETKERRRPTPFHAADLHEYLAGQLRAVALPNLKVKERLFVSGRDVWQFPDLLPDLAEPPVTTVPPAVLRAALGDAEGLARTYLCAEVVGWHGHLVVTTYFRAVRLGSSLYVEGASFALFPLRRGFYAVDRIAGHSPLEAVAASLWLALRRTVPLLLSSPMRVAQTLGELRHGVRRTRKERQLIADNCRFDYGAAASIRELAMAGRVGRYFTVVDEGMFYRVVRSQLLGALVEFLQDHDVDTGAVVQYQTQINNSGVLVNGTANGVQVGDQNRQDNSFEGASTTAPTPGR
jgi:hypothetical protein